MSDKHTPNSWQITVMRGLPARHGYTNMTLCSLERRGLVREVPTADFTHHTYPMWELTDDGRAVLAKVEAP